jgi:O-antigen biosynthesis protein WbqP
MKRLFDLFFGVILSTFFLLPMLFIAIIVRLSSNGPALFWSERVGRVNVIFKMPKFRSMRVDSPNIASHLIKDPNDFFSPVGSFLRSSSLDELPQLFSIVKGDMSFVGPRPALFNQNDLIALRIEKGIDKLLPGVTGWAQINGRDNLSIEDKVALDDEYLQCQSFWFDMKILWITILKVIKRDNISH